MTFMEGERGTGVQVPLGRSTEIFAYIAALHFGILFALVKHVGSRIDILYERGVVGRGCLVAKRAFELQKTAN